MNLYRVVSRKVACSRGRVEKKNIFADSALKASGCVSRPSSFVPIYSVLSWKII